MFTNPYNDIYNDILYFKALYPDGITSIYSAVSDACDRLEYDKSFMYDEFPDKVRIRRLASDIMLERGYSSPDFIEVLLLNEFIHRRIRRRTFQ